MIDTLITDVFDTVIKIQNPKNVYGRLFDVLKLSDIDRKAAKQLILTTELPTIEDACVEICEKLEEQPDISVITSKILNDLRDDLCIELESISPIDSSIKDILHRRLHAWKLNFAISNLATPYVEAFKEIFSDQYMHIYNSCEIWLTKPDPALRSHVLIHANTHFWSVPHSSMLMVWDNPINDVQFALDNGIEAALVDRSGKYDGKDVEVLHWREYHYARDLKSIPWVL